MIEIVNTKNLYSALIGAVDFCRNHIDENVEILVPDKLSLFMEQYLFKELNIDCSFKIKVSTLNRFAKKRIIVDSQNEISTTGSIVLIHKILNDNLETLKTIKSKAYSYSYAENIYNTIAQLKSSRILPDEMMAFKSSSVQLTEKINDLGFIYNKYENKKAGKLDESDEFLMSVQFIQNDLADKNVLLVGFDDFTAIQYNILEKIAINAKSLSVFNYATNSSNKYIFSDNVKIELKKLAIINEINFIERDFDANLKGLNKYLSDELYSTSRVRYLMENPNLKIFAGNKIQDEFEFVARDIIEQIMLGEKFGNFGVAVFDVESYQSTIKEIFSKYQINYYIDAQFTLNKSIFYKFLCSVMKFYLEGYELTHLIDIINSPFFDLENENKIQLIDYLIKINYRGKLDGTFNEDFKESINLLKEFILNFEVNKKMTISDFISMINKANASLNLENRLVELADNCADISSKLLLTKSFAEIQNLLKEISIYQPEIVMDDFQDMFEKIASNIKMNNLPVSLDAVKVIDAKNVMESFDYLYMVNCTSRNAPSLKHDCGIILDKEIDQLNFQHKLSPTIAFINRLTRLRLFNSLTMFNKNLVITYSNEPSEIVRNLCDKIDIATNDRIISLKPIDMSVYLGEYTCLSSYDEIEFKCKYVKNDISLNSIIKLPKLDNLSKDSLNIFDNMKTISASKLENYFKCPFFAFAGNVLKIQERKDNEIQSLDVGNIMHEIAYKYYKLNKNVGELYDFCKKCVFDYVNTNSRLDKNINNPILMNLIDEAVRVLNGLNYIDKNSSFVPKYFEYDFANKTPIQITKDVSLIGKIDRVDVYSNYFRIVDYKTGSSDANLKQLYYGTKLQLFLYANAMEKILNKYCVGTFYASIRNEFSTDDDKMANYYFKGFFENEQEFVSAFDNRLGVISKSDIINITMGKDGKARVFRGHNALEHNEMFDLKEYSIALSKNAVDEIVSGYIKPSPRAEDDFCDKCPYAHICMKDARIHDIRKSKDVELSSFKRGEE